jgi:hypothetical protein
MLMDLVTAYEATLTAGGNGEGADERHREFVAEAMALGEHLSKCERCTAALAEMEREG